MARCLNIYTTRTCPRCEKSKELFKQWDLAYTEVHVDQSQKGLKEMLTRTNGARSVLQIFLGDDYIGNIHERTEAHMEGELDNVEKA